VAIKREGGWGAGAERGSVGDRTIVADVEVQSNGTDQ